MAYSAFNGLFDYSAVELLDSQLMFHDVECKMEPEADLAILDIIGGLLDLQSSEGALLRTLAINPREEDSWE